MSMNHLLSPVRSSTTLYLRGLKSIGTGSNILTNRCYNIPKIHIPTLQKRHYSDSHYSEVSDNIRSLKDDLFQGNRRSLSQAITLLESSHPVRRYEGQYILSKVMQHFSDLETQTGKCTFRIGLSGPPGAGKSTLIEALGCRLIGSAPWVKTTKKTSPEVKVTNSKKPIEPPTELHRVAVLAVDPSSRSTGGSLLADKTRMGELSRSLEAYIRPSPSGGNLGGVARATNEAVLLCEAAGFDTVLVETVGVGQSETAVADMVDFFVLIIPPAGGDELQGIKRGIVEFADIVLVNKADGDLLIPARRICIEYSSALKYQRRRRPDWRPEVMMVSSHEGTGLIEFWNRAMEFKDTHMKSKELQMTRQKQKKVWMWNYVREGIWNHFCDHPRVREEMAVIEHQVEVGELAPGPAAELLIGRFIQKQ